MNAVTTVVSAVERTTRVRRHTPRRVIGDCPVCRRPRRLEISEGRDGRVLLRCQAGCETQAVLDRLGLGWPDLFEQVSYVPPAKSAERLVLDAITRSERWTITTHDFGDDLDLALAVEIAEHLLPARHRVRDRLRFRAGRKIAWELFPLTIEFVVAVARKLGARARDSRQLGREARERGNRCKH